MFTVLIPAFNRPHLLRVALQSIAKQTCLHYIDKVVVSENGLNKDSKLVCDEFPQLPIEYFYQAEQLPVLDHLRWLMLRKADGYVAFLCDDDWWNLYHIELAVKSLQSIPDSIAYFSNFVWTNSENKVKFDSYIGARLLALESDYVVNYDLLKLERTAIFLTSFIVTPFHFSALVCKADVLAQASAMLSEVHPTYSDRALWASISTYGPIVFNPLATTIVRSHPGQDSHNYSSVMWRNENQNGSLYILSKSEGYGINVKKLVNDAYLRGDAEERAFLTQELARIFINEEYVSWYEGYDEIVAKHKAAMQESRKAKLKRKVLAIFKK